jgi:rfaE bifunctional protein kinase chain/domain
MIDSYLFGNVERISPEAPVPIVDITKKINKLGGAANVATNIKNLGGTPIVCSVIGNDDKGKILLSLLEKLNITTNYILTSEKRITTDKTRIIGNNHQMLRIDEEIKSDLDDEKNEVLSVIKKIFSENKIDCVLFQDYDKGVLDNYLIKSITKISNDLNIPIIVDPKKKNFSFYKNIKLFKPNLKEFKDSIGLNIIDRTELLYQGSKILHNRGIKIVFVTLSEDGIFISYKDNNEIINKIIPGTKRDIVDVSGAGDTVISVVSMLIDDINIEDIAKISNLAGGIVCEEIGVVPIDKNKLMKEYNESKKKYFK